MEEGKEGLFKVEGKNVLGKVLFTTDEFRKRYRTNFDIFHGKTHKDFVIHHLIEQQGIGYASLVDDLLLHTPANQRAITRVKNRS